MRQALPKANPHSGGRAVGLARRSPEGWEPDETRVLARGLGYRYPGATEWALREVNLGIAPGEYILLAGLSGSGKSTLLRTLNGLVPHFYGGRLTGAISIGGWDVATTPTARLVERVGIVFQNPAAQLFSSTVARELQFGPASLGLTRSEIETRVAWAAEVTGVTPWLDRPPHALSGGQQQRVAVAAILAMRPALLALDEPFAHLDAESADALAAVLREIHRAGTTIVIAEHHLGQMVQDATRLVVLRDGRIVADGAPRATLASDAVEGLNLPPLVRRARDEHWPTIPLTIDEAIALAYVDERLSYRGERRGRRGNIIYFSVSSAPSAVDKAIVAEDVQHSLDGRPALAGVSFSIQPGERVAVLGRNGSGKTTLLRHLNGLLKPQRGRLLVLGEDTRQRRVSDLARVVGLAFQDPTKQLFQPTVRREIEAGPRTLKTLDPAWLTRLYETLGLTALLDRSPYRLSEGERRRVALAAALASRPHIIALDEPALGQDGRYRAALTDLMNGLAAEGRTVILVTHDVDLAAGLDRWLLLADGRILGDGAPDAVMADTVAMAAAGLRPTDDFEFTRRLTCLDL